MPLKHEFEFDGGEELTFLSAKKVRKSVKDRAQVFVMLASLEPICKGVVCDLTAVCQLSEVFSDHKSLKYVFDQKR